MHIKTYFNILDDEIRQNEGFKNVSLGNVILAGYKVSVTPFLSKEDAALLQKWCVSAFELQVSFYISTFNIYFVGKSELCVCLVFWEFSRAMQYSFL